MSVETMRRDLDDLREAIYGNGKEGLRTMMTRHEILLNQLVEAKVEQRKFLFAIVGTVLAAAIIGIGSFMFSMARMRSTEELVVKSVQRIEQSAAAASSNRP
jgi:hypothetical protein